MFFNQYLNEIYMSMLTDKYEEQYLMNFDENNFKEIYLLLKQAGFYYLEDIILYYLELFECDKEKVEINLSLVQEELGNNYVSIIGKDLSLLEKLLPTFEEA